jgi:hypothetical protein
MKMRPVRAELFHADRRTDGRIHRHDEANSHFTQFCARAKKTAHFVHKIRPVRGDFFPSTTVTDEYLERTLPILREHWLALFHKRNKTILLNTTVSYYEKNIYVYKIPHVSTSKGHHQARINTKEGSKIL